MVNTNELDSGAVQCATCGYLLRGLPENARCPECGGAERWTVTSGTRPNSIQRKMGFLALMLLVTAHLFESGVAIAEFMYWRQVFATNPLVVRAFLCSGLIAQLLAAIAGGCVLRSLIGFSGSVVLAGLRVVLVVASIACVISAASTAVAFIAVRAILSDPVFEQALSITSLLTGSSHAVVVAIVFLLLALRFGARVGRAPRFAAFSVAAIYGLFFISNHAYSLSLAFGRGLEPMVGGYAVRVVEECSLAILRAANVLSATLLIGALIWIRELRAPRRQPSRRGHETDGPG